MKNRILYIVIGLIVMFALMKQCEGEPKVVTKTVTKIVTKHDTINNVIIKEVPKTVYVEKVKTVKGKDSIIYKDKPSETTITANEYQTEVKSNKATASLKITTTGELLDVLGVITYPEKETITETIKIRDASGLYLYGSAPITAQALTPELGLQFNIKNKMFVSGGVQYNNLNNNVNILVGIGVKLF